MTGGTERKYIQLLPLVANRVRNELIWANKSEQILRRMSPYLRWIVHTTSCAKLKHFSNNVMDGFAAHLSNSYPFMALWSGVSICGFLWIHSLIMQLFEPINIISPADSCSVKMGQTVALHFIKMSHFCEFSFFQVQLFFSNISQTQLRWTIQSIHVFCSASFHTISLSLKFFVWIILVSL